MKETAHLRITAQEAKELYLSGLFTAQAYLYILVRALRKNGWWLYFDVKEFCQKWGIPERSFYRAKAILVSKGYLEEDIKGQIGLRCPVEDEASAISGSPSAISGSPSAISGSPSAISGSGRNPKPAQDKASTTPTDLSHISSDLSHVEGDEDCLNENEEATAKDGLVDPQPAEDPIDVAKILEETKKQLLAAVQKQRRGIDFRGGAALGALNTTPSSHGGHGERYGQWDRGDIPDLASTVATEDTTDSGSDLHPEANTTPSRHGSHKEHHRQWPSPYYRWHVRGGGLQPLAGILSHGGYHEGVPPFPRGIPQPAGGSLDFGASPSGRYAPGSLALGPPGWPPATLRIARPFSSIAAEFLQNSPNTHNEGSVAAPSRAFSGREQTRRD